MAKIIAWLVVIFIVLLALRMINMRKARGRGASAGKSAAKSEPMVRCVRCTVYLPRAEAIPVEGGYACAEGQCAKR
jgi:ribosomal protein S26